MIEALGDLLQISRAALTIGALVFMRVGAVMAVLPAFGEQSIPQRLRLVLALALTIVVAPAVAPGISTGNAGNAWMLNFLFSEVVIGLSIGVLIRLFIIALQIAGAIAAQSTSLSQIFGTNAIEPLPAIGHVMVIGGLALAVMSGLHVYVVSALIRSYEIFPAGQFPVAAILADWGMSHVGAAFSLAVTLAAPFVIASFVYNLALGAINKAMPQLMVAFVGAPAITAGGLIILALSLPILLGVWQENLLNFLNNPFGAPK